MASKPSGMWRCETGHNHSLFLLMLNHSMSWSEEAPASRMSTADVAIMVLAIVGIVGNLLNLVLLSAKRWLRKLQSLEDNANLILCVLAVSDLLFCVLAFVFPFTKDLPYYVKASDVSFLMLRFIGQPCINLCLMSSTYMVVLLAVERYIAMYYPLQAKLLGKPCSTYWLIALVLVLCACATLPYFLNNVLVECYSSTFDGEILYEAIPRWRNDYLLTVYISTVWPLIAVFIPLGIVFFCNFRLVQGLQKVMSNRKYQVTLILIVIVFLSVLLVIPAEIVKFINPYRTWGDKGYIVAHIVNTLQTGNFAVNFFLYCALDREYRQICRTIFCCCCGKFSSNETPSRNVIPLVRTSRSRFTLSVKHNNANNNRNFV